MNRLQSELQRLYLLPTAEAVGPVLATEREVRALVIEVARPADWSELSALWRGVQADLQWPAPAIAVSGTEGLQLWFSLEAPVEPARAAEMATRLRTHYLGELPAARVRLFPSTEAPAPAAPALPAQATGPGQWSAFVAPDLAPVFADTPWLDIPPSIDGQADLLARLGCIPPAAFDAALRQLQPAAPAAGPAAAPAPRDPAAPLQPRPRGEGPEVDPKRFLQQVLNDEAVALPLRIQAAAALLHAGHRSTTGD